MKRFCELTVNEIQRNFYILKNYKYALVSNIISNFIFLGILLFIISRIFDLSQAFMIILWPLMLALIGSGADNIKGDMQFGTLEIIVVKNLKSIKRLLIARILAEGIWTLPILLIIATAFLIISNNYYLLLIQVLTIIIPLIISGLGIGLIVSGLTFYYKDIGSTINILSLLLMATTILPWQDWLNSAVYITSLLIPFMSMNIYVQSNEIIFLFLALVNSILLGVLGVILFDYYFKLTRMRKGFVRY